MSRKPKQPKPMLEALSRPIMIHICKDGTISYRDQTKNEPIFNGVALPVFSVDTVEQARQLQIRWGRLQYIKHPVNGMDWYKLSVLADGTDLASRIPPLLKLEDLDGITEMFASWFRAYVHGNAVKSVLWATWQAVGGDAISACREAGEPFDHDNAIETILDAQRAEDYARTDAEKAALAEFRHLPWDQQCRVATQLLGRSLV